MERGATICYNLDSGSGPENLCPKIDGIASSAGARRSVIPKQDTAGARNVSTGLKRRTSVSISKTDEKRGYSDVELKSIVENITSYIGWRFRHLPDSDDLLSYVMWGVAKATKNYRPMEGGTFRGWIYQRVKWRVRNYLRDRRPLHIPLSFCDQESYRDHNPEDIIGIEGPIELSAEMRSALNRAVDRLPEDDRQIILAYYWDGDTLQEIASFLGVSGTTVANKLTLAKATLKRLLTQGANLGR
jgi:RNA polymerase sigma factor (sigma-70 family)